MVVIDYSERLIIEPNHTQVKRLDIQHLHVITVISNPCGYQRRVKLAKKFIKEMETVGNRTFSLYVVELAYNDQKYTITDSNNPRHLQLRANIPMWHKENMINIAVQKLLPKDWQAMAWLDADIEFDTPYDENEEGNWVRLTLNSLRECNIVQMYSLAIDMNRERETMSVFHSFGYKYIHAPTNEKGYKVKEGSGKNYWHPGFAWAIRRELYDAVGGLFERAILGSGDYIMAMAMIGRNAAQKETTDDYKDTIQSYVDKMAPIAKLGYIQAVIRHNYHGSKINRKYVERVQILIQNKYRPSKDIEKREEDGLLIPRDLNNPIYTEIMQYFCDRKEDD